MCKSFTICARPARARGILAQFPTAQQGKTASKRKRWSWLPSKLLHAVYAMLKHRQPYNNPHISSPRRRRLGLDISLDVSVEDGWRGVYKTSRRADVRG